MQRGEIRWYNFAAPDKRRPVLIITRSLAIPLLEAIVVASITTTIRDIGSEVYLSPEDGMPRECVANMDNIFTIRKSRLGKKITVLSAERLTDVNDALAFALGMDDFL